MNRPLACVLLCLVLPCRLSVAQEVSSLTGWDMSCPTPGTHRLCVDMASPRGGKGAGRIAGASGEGGARGCFIQEFHGKTALRPGRAYRCSVFYRTGDPFAGRGQLLVDSYTKDGEKGRRTLLAEDLGPSASWKETGGEVAVPADAVRVRMLLYLRGAGTLWYDDAFLGEPAEGAANLLRNGGFEPAASAAYDLAPERNGGDVRFLADFENATLGPVKQIGPDEFYLHAFPTNGPHSPFLWFHFRIEGAADREITFHVNPSPFSIEKTGGNGTRLPVMSDDCEHWLGIEDKAWSADGTLLSFKHRFTRSPAWVASFFPFTADHVARFIGAHQSSPYFKASAIGRTRQGRDLRMYTITDPDAPDAAKRVMLFTALQHDLETTGALALEGLCRFLLSEDPRAAGLRRAFVIHAVPMMNPDGIAQGNMYCPVGNLNRQWGLNTAPETACVERFVRDLAARGKNVDLFMDFHGWCTPERTTLFMTFGREIADEATETDALRLAETIRPRLAGKVNTRVWRERVTTVTGITGDLNRLSAGWMRIEAGARLAYSIEIFGEGSCTHDGYLEWGRSFAEGIAAFYGVGARDGLLQKSPP